MANRFDVWRRPLWSISQTDVAPLRQNEEAPFPLHSDLAGRPQVVGRMTYVFGVHCAFSASSFRSVRVFFSDLPRRYTGGRSSPPKSGICGPRTGDVAGQRLECPQASPTGMKNAPLLFATGNQTSIRPTFLPSWVNPPISGPGFSGLSALCIRIARSLPARRPSESILATSGFPGPASALRHSVLCEKFQLVRVPATGNRVSMQARRNCSANSLPARVHSRFPRLYRQG